MCARKGGLEEGGAEGLPHTSLAIFSDFLQVWRQVQRRGQKRRLLVVDGGRLDALCSAGKVVCLWGWAGG